MPDQPTPETAPPNRALHPPLDEIAYQLTSSRDEAAERFGRLDDQQINWQPAPHRWSVAQCLDHLDKTYAAYDPLLATAITKARAAGHVGAPPGRFGWFERWFLRQLEPPPRRRFPAPRSVAPRSDHRAAEAMPRFLDTQARTLARLAEADGLDFRRVRIRSPFFPLMTLRLDAAFAIIAAHGRRHLWQATQVVACPDFPSAAAAD